MLLAFLFALTASTDCLIMGLSYGATHIQIKGKNIIILNIVSALVIALSLSMGEIIRCIIPKEVLPFLCFIFLFCIGFFRLCDGLIKNWIQKRGTLKNNYKFSFLNFNFILTVYSDPKKADVDASKTLSLKETICLGLALSLDGLFIGLGAALKSVNIILTVCFTFLMGSLFILAGYQTGKKWQKYSAVDLTFIGGILLMVLAFLRL